MSSSHRILFLTTTALEYGGVGRYSRYQIAALRDILGDDAVYALSLVGGDPEANVAFPLHWHGRRAEVNVADRVEFALRAAWITTRWHPDTIHCAHINLTPLARRLALLSGAWTILNVYGLEIWSELADARKKHMRLIDHVIADCHFTARYVVDAGLHSQPATVIWDPVDLDRFSPGPIDPAVVEKYNLPDPAEHFIVMSLGRLAKAAAHKGFDRLIPVVAELATRMPHLRLVIAGRGDDRPRLEALCADHGITDRVVFTGSVDEADLPGLYRCAHIFSLVSDRGHGRGEGIPLTPLEAMACGVPVIVGNEDGSQEAVVDDRNGRIVSPRDPDAHCNAILELAADRAALAGLRAQARAVAEENFSYTSFVEKHRVLLDRQRARHDWQPAERP